LANYIKPTNILPLYHAKRDLINQTIIFRVKDPPSLTSHLLVLFVHDSRGDFRRAR